jgi:hypothetical protein
MKIECEGVVDELLEMKRNLGSANILIVRVVNLRRNIKRSVVVWVRIEKIGDRQERGRIKIKLDLSQVL